MSDRTCTTCSLVFKYPTILKKHFKRSIHCRKTEEEINSFFNAINLENKVEDNLTCLYCNTTFTVKRSLTRHSKICKRIDITKDNFDKILGEKVIDFLKNNNPQAINNNNNINNTTNIHNQGSIHNGNNTFNIFIINPVGHESLPSLGGNSNIKKRLLEGTGGILKILSDTYEKEENQNFFKENMNQKNISYLSEEYKLGICQENKFIDKTVKQCIGIGKHYLTSLKNNLSVEEIVAINNNIKNIPEDIMKDEYQGELKSILYLNMKYKSKKTKENITKFIKDVKENPEVEKVIKDKKIEYSKTQEQTNKELKPILTLGFVNKYLGDPYETKNIMNVEYNYNQFTKTPFETTTYYDFWMNRAKDEEEFLYDNPKHTIADVVNFNDRKEKIMECIEIMREQHNKLRKNKHGEYELSFEEFNLEIPYEYLVETERKMKVKQGLIRDEGEEDDDDCDVAKLEDLEGFSDLEDDEE